MRISKNLEQNIQYLSKTFPLDKSFDLITRELFFGNLHGYLVGVNGFINQSLLQRLFSDLQNPSFFRDLNGESLHTFLASKIGYSQVTIEKEWDVLIRSILSGPCVLFIDGYEEALIIDTRNYPARGIEEPENEKIMRGSKDGFVETLLYNANMIRRRIRSPKLTFEIKNIGTQSKTDVAIAYIEGDADADLIAYIKEKIQSLTITSLTMGTKSLQELIFPHKWYHPLPSFFQTERPDVACSYLLEGYILLMVDNTPSVLVLPCSIFQFTQSPEDYYKSTLTGNYIRMIRFICIFLSLLLLPTFLLLSSNPQFLPDGITLTPTGDLHPVRIFVYVLFAELLLDLFKYSSSHSPGGFSGSLGIVGGLLIGDVAVKLQWASTEIIFYAAATLLASLSLSSIEFADAIRVYRLFLIFCTGFFHLPGYLCGILLILVSILTTPSFAGRSYFWPLYPFRWNALKTLLIRYPASKAQPTKIWRHETTPRRKEHSIQK